MLYVPLCSLVKHLTVLLDMEVTHDDPADWMFCCSWLVTMWGHGIKLQKVNFTAVMTSNLGKHYVYIHWQVIKVTLEIRCFAH